MKAIITIKGQIVIPVAVRRKLHIEPGTRIKIEVDEERQRIILTPIAHEHIHNLRGKYRGKDLLQALMVGWQREREL